MTGFSFDFDRAESDSIKWSKKWLHFKFQEEDLLPLWVADADYSTCKKVEEAIIERAKHRVYGYADISDNYFPSIENWMVKNFNWRPLKEWMCLSPGVLPAIGATIQAFTEPKDEVLVMSPIYENFFNMIKYNGRIGLPNNLKYDGKGGFEIDFVDLEEKLKRSKVKLLLFCNPHNPVGRVWTRDEVQKVAELCLKHGVLVYSDEIHQDYLFNGTHTVFASLSQEHQENCIIATSAAKTFNLSGLKQATMFISNRDIRKKFQSAMKANGLLAPNIFGLIATEMAYTYGQEWIEEVRAHVKSNYELLDQAIKDNQWPVEISNLEGTYLVWMDFSKMNLDHKALCEFVYKEAKLGLANGKAYGQNGEGFMRWNLACSTELLKEAIKRLDKAFKAIKCYIVEAQ